jgi:deazaflavin-dependent oxidoreductase (nitroreductase family)
MLAPVRTDRWNSALSRSMGGPGLRLLGKANVWIYRVSGGRRMARVSEAPVLLLTTIGRKSGQARTAPVCFLRDGEQLTVIGSNAGNDRPPAWALNLLAHPDAEVEIRGARSAVTARVARGAERDDLWRRMSRLYHGFDDYEQRTGREIKVFVLDPRASDAAPRAT